MAISAGTRSQPNSGGKGGLSKKRQSWDEKYEMTKPFIGEDGAMSYTGSDLSKKETKAIRGWVCEQRRLWLKKRDGEHSSLTDEREKLLLDAGFQFDINTGTSWGSTVNDVQGKADAWSFVLEHELLEKPNCRDPKWKELFRDRTGSDWEGTNSRNPAYKWCLRNKDTGPPDVSPGKLKYGDYLLEDHKPFIKRVCEISAKNGGDPVCVIPRYKSGQNYSWWQAEDMLPKNDPKALR